MDEGYHRDYETGWDYTATTKEGQYKTGHDLSEEDGDGCMNGMSIEKGKLIRYFIENREVTWDEYTKAEGGVGVDVKQEEPECDHKGHYRLVNGLHVAIRICTGCGKSWRMPTQGDYCDGQYPDAAWEEIDEPVRWAGPVLPDYEG